MIRVHRSRVYRAGVAALAVVVLGSAASTGSGAAPPTSDPPTAAEHAAGWLATQIDADGNAVGGFDPLGDAGAAALALAAAGVEAEAFDRALGNVVAHAEMFIKPGADDDAGRIGKALMLAEVAGLDPHDFGGIDLVARLAGTLGDFEPGLYGAGAPNFDGAFRQGLALAGLVAVGVTPPAAAVDWLLDQQCGAATPAAEGGWQPYRADTGVPCAAPDPIGFAGADTDSTSLALLGLAAVGESPTHSGLDFLQATQQSDGGWAFLAGGTTDPNSTSLAIEALLAWGEDPDAWGSAGARPYDSLLSWAVPCGEENPGGFATWFSEGAPNLFANLDAIVAASGHWMPLEGPVDLAPVGAEPCIEEPTTTTTDPGDEPVDDDDDPLDDGDTSGGVPDGLEAAPAAPVAAVPAFTG